MNGSLIDAYYLSRVEIPHFRLEDGCAEGFFGEKINKEMIEGLEGADNWHDLV